MLSTLKTKKKRKPSTPRILRNVKMVMTLSDRLKQAGIKECESNSEIKTTENLSNNSKKRKNRFNRTSYDKHTNSSFKSPVRRKKNVQAVPKEFFSPCFKSSYQNEAFCKKISLKNAAGFSEKVNENSEVGEKKMILKSLDFIKDCQKYQKKVMSTKNDSELNNQRKSVRGISTNQKQNLNKKEESQKLQEDIKSDRQQKDYENIKKEENFASEENKTEELVTKEDSPIIEKSDAKTNSKKESFNKELKNGPKKVPADTYPQIQYFFDSLPSDDVAKIDKKYLKSLLSLATAKETKATKNLKESESKETEETADEMLREPKNKTTNKAFFESKIRHKISQDKYFGSTPAESRGTAAKMQNDSENIQITSCKDQISARILRDSTKSELQIQLQKEKNFENQTDSALSKHEVNDIRKKRKIRNKALKNNNEEFVEKLFPGEVSKVDVKELWRRESRKKSDNSLSSRSSCMITDHGEIPSWKNLCLESYKILQKLAEEQVNKKSEKSENKENIRERENLIKMDEIKKSLKDSEKTKNICKKLKVSLSDKSRDIFRTNVNEINSRRPVQAILRPHNSIYEGEKENSRLINLLTKDKLEDSKSNLKLSEEKEKKCGKIPRQIVQNWSILNRLEQAFLALGTPIFQNKNMKNSEVLNVKGSAGNEKKKAEAEKIQGERLGEKSKKLQKNKEVLPKTDKRNLVNEFHSSPETCTMQNAKNNKSEGDGKRNILSEKKKGIKPKREPDGGISQVKAPSAEEASKDRKSNAKQKKGKLQTQPTSGTHSKKTNLRHVAKSKVADYESGYAKREILKKKPPSRIRPSVPSKPKKLAKKKSSRMLLQNKNSEKALERKRTFDVISIKDTSIIQAQKSKSCNKIDDNPSLEKIRKRFLQTKNQELKSHDLFENKSNPKGRSVTNDPESKIKSDIPKNLAKLSGKEKTLQPHEKKTLKGTRENVVKTSKGRINQDKKSEKAGPIEEIPRQILGRKELNHDTSTERVIKERSILSMRGNKQILQASGKNFLQLEERDPSDFTSALKTDEIKSRQSNTGDLIIKNGQKASDDALQKPVQLAEHNYSSISCMNVSTYDLTNRSAQNCTATKHYEVNISNYPKKSSSQISKRPNVSSLSSDFFESEQGELNTARHRQLWEQDIRCYHAIVREIMSHYRRIDGLLKQSGHSRNLLKDSVNLMSASNDVNDDSSNFFDNSQNINIQEYRKKIISEYQAVPIFEYKTKLQQEKEKNFAAKEAKRNLSVVKDLETEIDLDVKDYQPNIQNVLDSQLYVDAEMIIKQNDPKLKFKEKKSSLQEIILCKNEKMVNQEEYLRSSSMPKTFRQLPHSSVHSFDVQKLINT